MTPEQDKGNSDLRALRRYVTDSSQMHITHQLVNAFTEQAVGAGLHTEGSDVPTDTQIAGCFAILRAMLREIAGSSKTSLSTAQVDNLAARVSSFPADGQPPLQVPYKELRFRRMVQECWNQAIEKSGAPKLPSDRSSPKSDTSRTGPG